MGHERFYNFLLVAMGNVVSALLMYALQAAWLCQRLIDQDYRQNHGSRLTPILDGNDMSTPIEIVSTPSDFVLSKSAHYRIRPSRHGTRNRKFETIRTDSSKSQKSSGENRRRKYGHCNQMERDVLNKKLYLSHPYLENVSEALTIEYMNGLGQALGLRRAFSDINLSSSWSEFKEEFCKKNHNCMTDNKIDETAVSVTDKDFFSLIFAKGYVT